MNDPPLSQGQSDATAVVAAVCVTVAGRCVPQGLGVAVGLHNGEREAAGWCLVSQWSLRCVHAFD
jgi:hypothetical protein